MLFSFILLPFFWGVTVEVSGGGTPSRSTDWLGLFNLGNRSGA